MHTCKLSRAKNYQRTLIPIKYEQPLPTHTYPKAQLYIVVTYKIDTESVTTKQNYRNLRTRMYGKVRCLWHRLAVCLVVVVVRVVGGISVFKCFYPVAPLRRPAHASLPLSLPLALQPLQPMASATLRASLSGTFLQTPSIAFRHLPPNSARFSYATD